MSNFDFLRNSCPKLAELGAAAEKYAIDDPVTCLQKLRTLVETLVKNAHKQKFKNNIFNLTMKKRLNDLAQIMPPDYIDVCFNIWKRGSDATHDDIAPAMGTDIYLKMAWELCVWYFKTICNGDESYIPNYINRHDIKIDDETIIEEIKQPNESEVKKEIKEIKETNLTKISGVTVKNDTADLPEKDEMLRKTINLLNSGNNIFVTGGAGTGKSTLLEQLKKYYGDKLHITSTTGISALNVNGQTIHSWSGMGLVNDPRQGFDFKVKSVVNKINDNEFLCKKLFDAKMLAIDEISMMDNITFDFINKVLKIVRHNNKPFGGIQVLLFGDFFQLPPVAKNIGYDFCFYSDAWDELELKSIILEVVHRQDDPDYIRALKHVREGIISTEDEQMFLQRVQETKNEDKENETHVFGTNDEVKNHNRECFNKLSTRVFTYNSQDILIKFNNNGAISQEIPIYYSERDDDGGYPLNTNLSNDEKKLIKSFNRDCRAPHELKLRVGVRVMLLRNIDVSRGLVNGSRGKVVELSDNEIVVQFDKTNEKYSVEKVRYEEYYSDDLVQIERTQYPLALAYAMTVHKSQGLTLEKLVINFDHIFDSGHAYVALSRTKSLKGLLLETYDPEKIKASDDVLHFYSVLKEKNCYTKKDYPDSKYERLDFEDRLEYAMKNEAIQNKKKNYISKSISQNNDIYINYYENKAGWRIVPRKITPSRIGLGRFFDEIDPKEYRRQKDKYYIKAYCYKAHDDREFKLDMLEIVEEDF